jgi:hypothetical protein
MLFAILEKKWYTYWSLDYKSRQSLRLSSRAVKPTKQDKDIVDFRYYMQRAKNLGEKSKEKKRAFYLLLVLLKV